MKQLVISAILLLSTFGSVNAQTPAADSVSKAPNIGMADYKTPKKYVVDQVNVKGVQYFDKNIIRTNVGFNRGDTITIPSSYVSNAVNKLWEMKYFSDVQIIANPKEDGKVDFDICLQERPRIYRWTYTGARKGEANDLKDKLKITRGDQLSEHLINKSENIIRQFYIDKGFRNVDVKTIVRNDSVMRNAVNLEFAIHKNPKVRIAEIKFDGNQAFTDNRLRRTFKKTHQISALFFQSNKYKEKEYAEDKENLMDFYNSKGYRNANIVSDSIYKIGDNRLGIKLNISEGNQYYFRNITWVGNSVYDTKDLSNLLAIKRGDLYDRKSLYKRLGYGKEDNIQDESTVKSLYQNNGYLMSDIDPS